MAIKEGDIIKVGYVGTFDDGTIFDSTEANGDIPLKFEVGAGQIIPGFDNSVVGKNVGEEFNIRLEPSEAIILQKKEELYIPLPAMDDLYNKILEEKTKQKS